MNRRRIVIRGNTYENVLNLGRGYIEKIERKYGGTRQGEEELFAKMFEDADGATAKAEWIKRRPRPDTFVRRVIGLDVAVTKRGGSDTTGMMLDGLGVDDCEYVIKDLSGKYSPDEWGKLALDNYVTEECDCIVVETNKGGDLVTQNLRASARDRKWSVIVLGKDERPRHVPGVIYIREVYARGEKADRAKPLSTAYERGQIVHVEEVNLEELEEILTTWVPTPGVRSPDRLDAHVHASVELLGLNDEERNPKAGFVGVKAANQALNERRAEQSLSRAELALRLGAIGGGRI